jgi:hypothetical protein
MIRTCIASDSRAEPWKLSRHRSGPDGFDGNTRPSTRSMVHWRLPCRLAVSMQATAPWESAQSNIRNGNPW